METIKLNVSENTFKRYLLTIGYSLNIRQYSDMIFSIRRQARNKIIASIQETNLEKTMYKVFNNEVSLLILEDITKIKEVSTSYFKELIDNNNLNGYLEESFEEYTEEEQREAYIVKKINKIKINKVNVRIYFDSNYKKELTRNRKGRVRLQKCINENKINILKEEKEKIDSEINNNLKKAMLKGILRIDRLEEKISITSLTDITTKNYLSKYIEKNILPKDITSLDNYKLNVLYADNLDRMSLEHYIETSIKHNILINNNKSPFSNAINIVNYLRREYVFPMNTIDSTQLDSLLDVHLGNGGKARVINYQIPDLNSFKLRVLFLGKEYPVSYQDILDFANDCNE